MKYYFFTDEKFLLIVEEIEENKQFVKMIGGPNLLRSHTMSLLPRQQEAKIVSFSGFHPTWKTSSLHIMNQHHSLNMHWTNKQNNNMDKWEVGSKESKTEHVYKNIGQL